VPHSFAFFANEWVSGIGTRQGKSENDTTVESHPSKNEGWGIRLFSRLKLADALRIEAISRIRADSLCDVLLLPSQAVSELQERERVENKLCPPVGTTPLKPEAGLSGPPVQGLKPIPLEHHTRA